MQIHKILILILNNNKLNYNNNLIIKKDAEVQTIPIDDNMGNILEEQSQTIQMLQKKINNMESMLDKVLIKLREKNKNNNYENYIKEEKENSELELSNNNENEKSDSLNSNDNSREQIIHLSKDISNTYMSQTPKEDLNKNDFKIKENKLNSSSEFSISISKNNNNVDLTYKSNHNEQTLEIPVIKYNSEISEIDDTQNDL